MSKKPKRKKYKKLSRCKTDDERNALVAEAMEDGHSNKTAAKALGTTPGTIAGIRNRAKIPSKHRPTHGTAIEAASSPPPPEQKSLLEAEPEYEPPPQSAVDMNLRFAGDDWAHQCQHQVDAEGHLCSFKQMPGENYCPKHLHLYPKH